MLLAYFIVAFLSHTSSTLIGNYQLYNSEGDYLYDFSSNLNYARLLKYDCSSQEPIKTDRGTYLRKCDSIKLPTTSLDQSAVAYWINASTSGSGYIFSWVVSSQAFRVKYIYNTLYLTRFQLYQDSTKIQDVNISITYGNIQLRGMEVC
jgi:hypothetical protein